MKKHLSIVLGVAVLMPTVSNACKFDTVEVQRTGCVETRGVYDCSGVTVISPEHHHDDDEHREYGAPYYPLGTRLHRQRLPDRVRIRSGVSNFSSAAINRRMRIHHGARRGSSCIPTILNGVNIYNDCRSSTLLEHDVRYRVD